MSWRDQAACAGKPTAWFFGQDVTRGLEVCRGCPVRGECAAEADEYQAVGVWGGSNRSLPRYFAAQIHRRCPGCGQLFGGHEGRRVYCSDTCRVEARKRTMHESYLRRNRERGSYAIATVCENGGPGAAPTARGLDATCRGGHANGGR